MVRRSVTIVRAGQSENVFCMQTVYFFEKPVVQHYFKAALPYDVYSLKLGEGNIAKQLQFEYRRLCLEWLEHAEPRISKSVAKASPTGMLLSCE